MSRATSILALVQTLLVILGFAALGIVLKIHGYPDAPLVRWSPLAVFLRKDGIWLLLVPLMWTLLDVAVHRRDFLRLVSHGLGVVLAITILVVFFYAAIFPFTRLILYLPPP